MTDVRDDRPRRSFDRSRLRLGLVIAVVCGAIAFLAIQGLGNATTFYRDADEAVAKRDELGDKRFRLQGVVVPGSIDDEDADVLMVVGHAPGIPALTELLCDGEGSVEGHRRMAEGCPTCGVAVLHYAGRWADLDFGDARLERFHVCRDGE